MIAIIAVERQQKIVQYVQRHKFCHTSELAKHFAVSRETIRRDLNKLAEEGKLRKVHGGASSVDQSTLEVPFRTRSQQNLAQKRAIGRAAAELLRDGETIVLDTGSTVLEFVRQIRARNLKIFTFSLPVAMELVGSPSLEVYVLPGRLRAGELSVSGSLTEEILSRFYFDRAVIGVGGISLTGGVTDYHMEEASVRRAMIRRAREVMVLADYSKFGVLALNHVMPMHDVDTLVTDDQAPGEMLEAIAHLGVRVVTASGSASDRE